MKKLLLVIGFFIALSTSAFAQGAAVTLQCPTGQTTGTNQWTTCNSAHPLPVTSGSGPSGGAVEIFDGTNGPVAVKPASTAAVATDPSAVVQLNPDSPGIIALGAAAKAASVPVTQATDQYADACMNPLITKSSVPINITTATTTSLVAISGSTAIYVCHISFTISEVVTTPNTLQFEYGTSTNCTGTNKLSGLYGDGGVTAGDPIFVQAGYGGTLFTAPASNGLCALTAIGATGSFQGTLTYVQQ